MSIWFVIPLLTLVAFIWLIWVNLRHRPPRRVHKVFSFFLLAVASWSFTSCLVAGNLFPERVLLFAKLALIFILAGAAFYCHFFRSFQNKPLGKGVIIGYGLTLLLIPFIVQDYVIKEASVISGGVYPEFSPTIYPIALIYLTLVGSALLPLIKQYRRSIDPFTRNRIAYLVTGFGITTLFVLLELYPPVGKYPAVHLGNLGNAVFITCAIVKYQLLDIRIVVRRGLTYAVTMLCFAALYFALFFGLLRSLHLEASHTAVAAGAGVAFLIAILFYPLKNTLQGWAERLVYKETYDYRQMLLTFADKMSHVLNLEELAESMLTLITKAIHTKEVSLYLPAEGRGDFIARFNMPGQGNQSRMKLAKDNPIVTWLAKEGRPFSREQIDIVPQLKSLWEKEREQLTASEIELFFPIKSKGALVGILAVGRKLYDSYYRSEDVDLIMTMATEAGVVMENAQLYAAAKMRANTDELTRLFNHRYFHERLEEEIARGLRFGATFSLIFLDLDLFKRYNDIHGHLAGDEVLKQVGQSIRGSLRAVDMAFRYGGDEFAVILPSASSEDAYRVAERIHKSIEQAMSSKQALLTCSAGIASWPTDGVMREALIQCADLALYQAKQWGNRTCLPADAVDSKIPELRAGSEAKEQVLSTIYALAATVDARDHHTFGHSRRVSNYATALGQAIELPPERIAILRTAGLLHDIGKIGISDEVLNKTTLLNEEDWEPVHSHPALGVSILKHINGLAACLPGIQYHHERYDGTGYPSGLNGDNIPLDARIIAIADAYEAMTSPRPYRKGKLTHKQALEELEHNAGTQFDPELVKVFCTLRKRISPAGVRAI